MKQLILWLAVTTTTFSFAQQNFCSTEMDDAYAAVYFSKNRNEPPGQRETEYKLWVPIAYHLIGRDNGTGLYRLRDLMVSHCELNEAYDSLGMGFYIENIDTILNTDYYEFTGYQISNTIKQQNNISSVCNVYINHDPNGVCGFATFPGFGQQGIFLKDDCHGPGSTTLIHEMGHYMGQPHTFETYGGVEFVNGSNCASAGDGYCDTPADFLDYRWDCPYTGDDVDPNGDAYVNVLDESFYMCYSMDECQSRFSDLQKANMRETCLNDRTSHLYRPQPSHAAIPDAELVSPAEGDTTVPNNYATFVWRKVPGATHYNLVLPGSIPTLSYVDVVTTDTFYTATGLLPNRAYKWMVKAFNYGYVCGAYTIKRNFKTASMSAIVDVQQPSCNGQTTGTATATVLNGVAPFTFMWSTGDTTSAIAGLAAGDYYLTVTDTVGEIAVSHVVLTPSPGIQAVLLYDDPNLSVEVNGSGQPFSYSWSTGATSSSLSNVTGGTYSVIVSNSFGCTTDASVLVIEPEIYTPPVINSVKELALEAMVYPNPAAGFVVVQIPTSASNLEWNLTDLSGRKVAMGSTAQLTKGTFSISTSLLQNGYYLLNASAAGKLYSARVAVIH